MVICKTDVESVTVQLDAVNIVTRCGLHPDQSDVSNDTYLVAIDIYIR